jgi:hypothetical protein
MKRIPVLLTMILAVAVHEAAAIPAYARKYDMSCNVCHSPIPKLKPFGVEFAANGYQMKTNEPPRFTRETGDSKLLLMRELPLALRLDGFARYLPGNMPETDIEWPYILKILSSGQVANNVSYFLYFLFNERGEVAGVEDAFLYFNNIGNAPLDLTVGQYQVADPIFKRELRPTFEDYVVYTVKPGLSKANLTYDRGLVLNYTLPTGTDVFGSVVNGNGIGGTVNGENFDSDPYKNFFFRIAQQADTNLSLGTLAYLGKERNFGRINDFYMLGGDATVSLGQFELGVQYVHRTDMNPFFASTGASTIKSQGGFAQLTFAPQLDRSDWYMFLLYNKIESDLAGLNYHTMTGNLSYLLARNFKLMGEYTYDLEQEQHRVTFGFITAF